jgi:ribonuclease HII
LAMQRCVDKLQLDEKLVTFRLDGSLYAPSNFKQATIIKGDSIYPEIGLASIIAKETRDAYMKRIAKRFGKYELEAHKGYGTKRHRELISKFGLSPIHRVSYCKNIKVG